MMNAAIKTLKKIIPLWLFLSVFTTTAQPPYPDTLIRKFDDFRKTVLQEKIYVHTDQDFYLIGETLWFSIYYVDGSFHKSLDVSKVAYVEILDKKNVAVLQTKVSLKDGHGRGSVFLPATVGSGNYTLRAYTQWMKNFDIEFFFRKSVTIVNPFIKAAFDKPQTATRYNVEFFPEGGNLVNGIQCKIAFKISDNFGKGIDCTGALVTQSNDTVLYFTPFRFGMGNFTFTPSSGKNYRAIIRDRNGNRSTYSFPDAKDFGYGLSVSDSSTLLLKVTVSARNADHANLVYLFVHSRQIISKAELKYFENNRATFLIDKSKLPEGISHFTIFNEKQVPVCERLYFKLPETALNILAKTDQHGYGKRRKVTLQLQTRNHRQELIPANLSVAVHKLDSFSISHPDNILHYLFLSSDLKGNIESPEYYFEPGTSDAADNLMLTHGWRKFNWTDVLQGRPAFRYIPEYRGQLIKGNISRADTTAPAVLTYLSIPGKIIRLYGSRSNNNGEIQFEVRKLYGQNQIILKASSIDSRPVDIKIQDPFSKTFATQVQKPFQLTGASETPLLRRAVAMQAQDIYYEESPVAISTLRTDSVAFYGKADETYYLDNYTRFPVMEEVMREYVPGVFVRKRKDGFHFIVIDVVNGGVLPGEPMILLDGVPLFDADKIMSVDPLKIKKLEVVTRKYYLGPLSMPGIVSYTSYQGDVAGIEMDPGTVSMNYEGLQLQREFYSPRFETAKQLSSRVPDKRYLLFWSPQFTTKNDGSSQLEFYTSDITGDFQIVIEGLSKDGFAGQTLHTFTVK